MHSSRTFDVDKDDRSTTGTVEEKKEEARPDWSPREGMHARAMLQLGSVYNSADYISDRELSRHCRDDPEREQSHNEFIDYTTWLSY